ncbi:MAG: choice-of-anchor D domain-containing protein [Deltaproteobacteria bacterium]
MRISRAAVAQRKRIRPFAVAVALVAGGACQCDEDTLVRVRPQLEIDLERVDFGEVPVGATKRIVVPIANAGTAELVIVTATTSAPFGAVVLDTRITAGGTGLIDVMFQPTNDEAQSGTLQIESNDEDRPLVTLELTGQGVDSNLTIQPKDIDFGGTPVGATRVVELLMSSFGLEAQVGRIVAEGFDRPGHFRMTSLEDFSGTGTYSIGARSQLVFDLEYRPAEIGPDQGRLVFEVCGPRCGIEIDVGGEGAEASVRLRPAMIDFGTMAIGETKTDQIVVENLGNSALTVLSAASAGGPGLVITPSRNLPVGLEPGETITLTVELTAMAANEIHRTVVVTTNDAVLPEARASIVAEGQGPQFAVQPESITFGVQRDVDTYNRPLLLVNAGTTPVQVESVTLQGAPELGLGVLPALPARLGAGESLLVPVTFSPTAIGEYSGTVTVTSDDPSATMIDVPVIGGLADRICEIDAATQQLNFGQLPPGFRRQLTAQLTNIGFDTCTISSAAFRAPVDPAFTLLNPPWPATLNPGEQLSLAFEYTPTDRVESKANFTMQTTDPVFPERHLSLIGTGAGTLEVFTDPESVDFGVVAPQCATQTRSIRVYNTGSIAVNVTGVTLTSSTSEIGLQGPPMSMVLGSGGSFGFDVTYEPQDFDVDTAFVEVAVAELVFPLVVPVQGEGAPQPQALDVFQQRSVSEDVDVLFVIDDSCSMGDDQQALAANFSVFIQSANVRSVDFQIGVTTTTIFPDPGALVGPVLTNNTPNLVGAFQAQANVGVTGSGFERGLDAMLSALQAAEAGIGYNAALLRPGAARVVVIVTDEDDSSSGAPALYYRELVSRAPDGQTAIIVSGGASGCTTMGRLAFPAPRYEEFRRLARGITESICNDWGRTLERIGNAAFGLSAFFPLSSPNADVNSLVVRVDGQVVTSGWTYDPVANAVEFATPPPPGSTVEIEYTPTC